MKKTITLAVLTTLFFFSCGKPDQTTPPTITEPAATYRCECGNVVYIAQIGDDFDSALDSLLKVIPVLPNRPYSVVPQEIRVDYPYDDRKFYAIAFRDGPEGMYLQSLFDVLDTKGCWYYIDWLED